MIYSNEEILNKIKDEKVRKIAEFLDSKGIILIYYNDNIFGKTLRFLSTDKNVINIKVTDSCFLEVTISDLQNIYIFNDEKNLELIIDNLTFNINIGKYCYDNKIEFKYFEDFSTFNDILSDKKYLLYNLIKIENKDNDILVTLKKIKNTMHITDIDEFKYLVFANNNFYSCEEYDKYPERYVIKDAGNIFINKTTTSTISAIKHNKEDKE